MSVPFSVSAWRKTALIATVFTVLVTLVGVPGTPASAVGVGTFYNPIMNNDYTGGGDPWITRVNNEYVYTQSQGTHISIWRSPTITGMGAAPSKVVFREQDVSGLSELWAPEAHYINGLWYIYFAGIRDGHRTMKVLRSANSDPWSSYTYVGNLFPTITAWSIDATIGYINNVRYVLWSGTPSQTIHGGFPQNIYIARLDNPEVASTFPVMISTPTHAWEQSVGAVNEGPQFLQRNGKTFIIYSADGSWSDAYKLGRLNYNGGDPLDAGSWSKHPSPVFQSAGDVWGPGHGSFTMSPDGTEWWNIYHAAKYSGAGWNRSIRAQIVNWNADDTPNFGTPISPDIPQTHPSGESPGRVNFEAEDGTKVNAANNCKANASAGCVVGWIDTPTSSVTINVTAPTTGTYPISIRYTNGSANREIAMHWMSVNGGQNSRMIYYHTNDWDTYANAFTSVRLNAGNNSIRLLKGHANAEVDVIQRYPVLSPGVPGSFDPTRWYQFNNREAHRSLSVMGGGTADGTDNIIYDWVNATDQHWQIIATDSGYFRIMNRRSNKALSMENGGTENGARVHIWPWIGFADQQWSIEGSAPGHFQILNRASGRALSTVGGNTQNNTPAHIYDYLGNADDQDWNIWIL